MKTGGRARREVLIRLARLGPEPRIDVGADHGQVAAALGCIATERKPHRARGNTRLTWVIGDGLRPFRSVGTAIIAGMGANTITRILLDAPPVARCVLHAQDDPPRLRRQLAAAGWRIIDEALAPEAGRFAEVVVVERGTEPSKGLPLEYGPCLLEGSDPHIVDHLTQLLTHLDHLVVQSDSVAEVCADFRARRDFVQRALSDRMRAHSRR